MSHDAVDWSGRYDEMRALFKDDPRTFVLMYGQDLYDRLSAIDAKVRAQFADEAHADPEE